MERKKNILITLLMTFTLSSFPQSNVTIYKAYTIGDMSLWKKTMDTFTAHSNDDIIELINYQYGYIAFCIDKNRRGDAKAYIHKAEILLTHLEKQNYKPTLTYAYRSALVGFNIGLYPYKAPFIGPESLDFAERSVATDSTNYFGYLQLANIAYYTPSIVGGSKTEATKYYLKSLEIIEKKQCNIKNNWNYLNLLATIINAYYEQKQYTKAEEYCIKTLAIEKNFDWLNNELYPNILKALQDE